MPRVIGISIASAAWFAFLGSFPLQAAAGSDAERARLLAASCSGCHGTNGQAQAGASMLAGIDRSHFITQMKAFQSGQRPATVMQQLAKGYDDAEIDAMASYFAAQRRAGAGS